ncbi:hypothetical protein Hbl1158_07735 [Halobaculum sp. CBA1158]|uniref:hypothetical protein n=1 Tax=Halobaculum sp. CBA1158 TaxID=2904243 RepID=UPI001F344A89|nr:hypothetical protein [Halobaculum sp. CBA1158]UIO98456.1 hypothetical protein Hbl1158_07735 [Halobaculum sp. CBA1158]
MLAVSGVAFASTANGQVAWQQRDAIDVSPTTYAVEDGEEPTMVVEFAVSNPTRVSATIGSPTVVVYNGSPRDGDALTVPRSADLVDDETVLAGGETTTLTMEADIDPDDVGRARAAIDAGTAVASGSFEVTVRDRRANTDV